MKKIRSILGVIIIMVLLVGCGKSNNVVDCAAHDSPLVMDDYVEEIEIEKIDGIDLKDQIIGEIDDSRAAGGESEEELHRISEIEEFYFSHIEIEGYELCRVRVSTFSLMYFYAPIGMPKDDECKLSTDIVISIQRLDCERFSVDFFDKMVRDNPEHLTDDGFVYNEGNCYIDGLIGDTLFMVCSPQHSGDYEFLRDIALQVQKSVELVDVEEEIVQRRRNQNSQGQDDNNQGGRGNQNGQNNQGGNNDRQ